MNAGPARPGARPDHRLIAELVEPGSRLLDIGCGDGALLELLAREKNVDGRGIEISQEGVNASVRRGLSVIQGDAETDLADYPDAAFDYVVLSQTLPAIRDPRGVLLELLRIGRSAIVSIPNFGHWRNRLHLLARGRMPAPRGSRRALVPDAADQAVHDQGFRHSLPRTGNRHRAPHPGRFARPGAPFHGHRPFRQPVRRAGGVPALRQPGAPPRLRVRGALRECCRPFARRPAPAAASV